MNLFIMVLFFIVGSVCGSFYNVIGIRLPKSKSFLLGRSFCFTCKRTLSWYELIPIISFILQRGKCRQCKEKISWIYPVGEIITGALFMASYAIIGVELELFTALLFVSMLMILFVSDIKYMIIPNKILLFFLPLFVIVRFVHPLTPWWTGVAGALIGFLLVALIIIVSRGGMGGGDMKLFGVLGVILGVKKVLLTFFIACFGGAFVGIILLRLGKIKQKQPIPFAPFIMFAASISYFYGELIIPQYLSLFI